jgi:hypothetical protein
MSAMDAHRLRLYELLKPKLDEEPARQLVLALSPEPDRIATKDDLALLAARIDARFDRMENVLTRRMVTIMGAWTILVGSTIGWVVALLH